MKNINQYMFKKCLKKRLMKRQKAVFESFKVRYSVVQNPRHSCSKYGKQLCKVLDRVVQSTGQSC